MPNERRTRRRGKPNRRTRPGDGGDPPDDRAAEVITVAWTASVTAVFLADVVTIAAHFHSRSHPEAESAPAFEAIMLLTASVMGLASLALLPVVWHARHLKPPLGFVVFAALVAAAPIAATVGRLLT
jgi:hypothetical protein